MPLKEDYIYFAGFIDGEGCIRVNNAPRLHITNTNEQIILWIKDTFGGYVWAESKSYIPNAKIRYIWELSSRKLLKLLIEIYPYLKIKSKQAKLVIDYYESGVTRHPSNIIKTNKLRIKLQRLNHKGVINKKEAKYAVA
jgi:hypothetical protein